MGGLTDQCPRQNKTMFVVDLECEYKEREVLEKSTNEDMTTSCVVVLIQNAVFRRS